MEKIDYVVYYWNDRKDCPVAVYIVTAEDESEAEDIARENGGKDYERDWPLLIYTLEEELGFERVSGYYENSIWTDEFKDLRKEVK